LIKSEIVILFNCVLDKKFHDENVLELLIWKNICFCLIVFTNANVRIKSVVWLKDFSLDVALSANFREVDIQIVHKLIILIVAIVFFCRINVFKDFFLTLIRDLLIFVFFRYVCFYKLFSIVIELSKLITFFLILILFSFFDIELL
jgi:hypothetical protein